MLNFYIFYAFSTFLFLIFKMLHYIFLYHLFSISLHKIPQITLKLHYFGIKSSIVQVRTDSWNHYMM